MTDKLFKADLRSASFLSIIVLARSILLRRLSGGLLFIAFPVFCDERINVTTNINVAVAQLHPLVSFADMRAIWLVSHNVPNSARRPVNIGYADVRIVAMTPEK